MTSMLGRVRGAGRRFLRDRLHVDVRRVREPVPTLPMPVERPTKTTTQFQVDAQFYERLAAGQQRSGMPVREVHESYAARMWFLLQALEMTRGVDGLVAECGVYRGLSSYLLCHQLRDERPGYDGAGFHGFDSFEGISEVTGDDALEMEVESFGVAREAGVYRADLETARTTLAEFPAASLHQGWLPEVLDQAPAGPYRFVHLDLDLHVPTTAGLDCFHPRLARGGAIVVDDFGAVRWPGVRRAVETFCAERSAPLLRIPTGQALVLAVAA